MPSSSEEIAIANDREVNNKEKESLRFLLAAAIVAAFGVVLILLYSLRFRSSDQMLRIFGVGMLVACAALLSGFLLGFIFAIPRKRGAEEKGGTTDSKGVDAPGFRIQRAAFDHNFNLVEISDWLTKIIVGVGLVELHSIPEKLGLLSYYLAPGLLPAPCVGGDPCSEPLIAGQAAGLAILIFFSSLGFLVGFVWTMVYFMRDLTEPYIQTIIAQQLSLKEKQQVLDKTSPILSAEGSMIRNQFGEAMATIEQSLKNDPRDGYAMITKARILKRQALQAGQLEDERKRLLNQALGCVDEAIALMPGKGEPLYNKACYQALLDPATLKGAVLTNLEAAFRLNPALRQIAKEDADLASLREDADFARLLPEDPTPAA
jgi:hypothetical protein